MPVWPKRVLTWDVNTTIAKLIRKVNGFLYRNDYYNFSFFADFPGSIASCN